jgi:hypothetical protein
MYLCHFCLAVRGSSEVLDLILTGVAQHAVLSLSTMFCCPFLVPRSHLTNLNLVLHGYLGT